MADDDARYELKTVRAIRGTEARATAKWQGEGWELVSKDEGRLQTQITFRRPKPAVPWRTVAILGGVGVLLAVGITIGALLEDDGEVEPQAQSGDSAPVAQEDVAPEPEVAVETPVPVVSETPQEGVLTIENNADLAALLTGPADGPAVEAFAAQYEGQLVEFDASVVALANHDGYATRYNLLLMAADFSETTSIGPNFQFRDVNTTSDLHYTNDSPTETIGVGNNLHVVARVGNFEPDSTLFLLEPVATTFR